MLLRSAALTRNRRALDGSQLSWPDEARRFQGFPLQAKGMWPGVFRVYHRDAYAADGRVDVPAAVVAP